MRKSSALWGTLLIFIGLVWIFDTTNLLNIDMIGSIMTLWPVFIVAAGITFFFKRESHIQRVILWILVFAIIGGYGIYLGHSISENAFNKTFAMSENIESASLKVDIAGANFDIGSSSLELADIRTNVKGIRFNYDEGKNPKIKYSQKLQGKGWGERQIFKANLNNSIPWDIEFNTGATSGTLNFKNVALEMCTINTAGCNLDIIIGNKQKDARIVINGGVVNLKLNLPEDVGLKVSSKAAVSKVNGTISMLKEGGDYLSDNYATAPNKLYLDIASAASNITVNR